MASYVDYWVRDYKKRLEKAIEKADKNAYEEYFKNVAPKLQKMFKKSVAKWYSGYSPKIYHRNRSLYRVLELTVLKDGIDIYLNDSVTTEMRKGGNVYDLSFKAGYHGGASSGDVTKVAWRDSYGNTTGGVSIYSTPHPAPGTPYYRTPHPYYVRWGYPAAKTQSPFDMFKTKIEEYESSEQQAEFDVILKKHRDAAIASVKFFR